MLSVSKNNKYFESDGNPFFWLADTAWLMFYVLDDEEIYTYLRNRSEKGYNVILATLCHEDARKSYTHNEEYFEFDNEAYWLKIEKTIELAKTMGITMALLPTWGSVVKKNILNKDNMEKYLNFIGKNFQKYDNIVWVLGGDIRGADYLPFYSLEASILKKYNPDRLMTFHPFGRTSSSYWFHNENWLDFNMFQSGHRRYDQMRLGEWDDIIENEPYHGEDSWKYVDYDLGLNLIKPVLDGEPSYEGIPQGLHDPHNPYWEEWDIRRYAYWSVFQGAAGHTYGNNAIMQFHKEGSDGAFSVREEWKDALHHCGCGQLGYLKKLMLSIDFINGVPKENLLLFGQKERYHRVAIFGGNDYLICYSYLGNRFMLKMDEYMHLKMEAYWMNPQDGTYSYIGIIEGQQKMLFTPVRRKGISNDWVLLLKKCE